MPRGRPKTVVAPCQYCNKQFKRQEHLLRHERTHTHEKPFTCDCGQGFSRQDLLTRHARLSHPSCPNISPPGAEAVQVPATIYDANAVGIDNLDLFWDPNFMTQDLLPTTLFDTNLSSTGTPPNIQPPQISSFSLFSSRLPSFSDTNDDLEDGDQAEDIAEEDITGANDVPPWVISESGYERFCLGAQSYSDVLPHSCLLPSRNSLTRYLEKYLRCVQEFLPIFHPTTFSVKHKNVELLLAIAALGAAYTYEHPKAYEMYFLAKAILGEKTRREDLELTSNLLSGQSYSTHCRETNLGRMQVFILLISFASWADKNFLPDALSMGSKLALLVRKNGISEPDEIAQNIDWLSWVAVEERRRTLFAAYVLLNMHSIAFGIPPLILNHEIGIFLPSYAETWKSIDATQWRQTTLQVECQFQDGLRCFFDGSVIPKDASVSSFSNYLLIHGILQQIYIDRHGSRGLLGLDVVISFETALCNWQRSWEQTYESTLDPLSPKGPFGLTATALLRLAYIRLNSELSPCQGLLSGDLQCITNRRPSLKRSPHIDKAILHAAHALSVPVRLGVTLMASTKTSIWTIEHSLCSLECALLLKDWLEMISTTMRSCGTEELRKAERKLLGIITGIIKESSFVETLDILEDEASRFQRMATTVVKLWAQIFQGIHVLEIDNVIGAGLQLLADSNSSPN